MCWDGNDGKCMHIMYSENKNGVPMYDAPKKGTRYIGCYMDYKTEKSKDPLKYTWVKYEYSEGIE